MENGQATSMVPAARAVLDPASVFLQVVVVLGGFRARYRERELVIDKPKAQAVLAYLALSASGEQSREHLAGLLWSESDEKHARDSLRQVVHKLRESLDGIGCGALRTGRAALAINPGAVRHDLSEVQRAAEMGAPHRLLLEETRLAEQLLAGFEELDPAFCVWLRARRQSFHDALLRALEPFVEIEGAVTPERRRDAARALLQLDPTHEVACRVLMRQQAEAGDPGGALRVYEKLWHVLDEDFDIEPSIATQELVADIKIGRIAPRPPLPPLLAVAALREQQAPTPATVATPTTLRIALLVEAFAVNGVAPEQAHLVHGFRHDLIARLVRFREWFVLDGAPAVPVDVRVGSRYRIGATGYQAGTRISMVLTRWRTRIAAYSSGVSASTSRSTLGSRRSSTYCGGSRSRSTRIFPPTGWRVWRRSRICRWRATIAGCAAGTCCSATTRPTGSVPLPWRRRWPGGCRTSHRPGATWRNWTTSRTSSGLGSGVTGAARSERCCMRNERCNWIPPTVAISSALAGPRR